MDRGAADGVAGAATFAGDGVIERVEIAVALLFVSFIVGFPMYAIICRWRGRPGSRRRTVGWYAWAGMLAIALILPLYNAQTKRARDARAEFNLRTLAQAISQHRAHTGDAPARLRDLTLTVTNAAGVSAGPFLDEIPSLPSCYGDYDYKRVPAGRYVLSVTGQGVTFRVVADNTVVRDVAPPGADPCPTSEPRQ